MSVLLRGQWVLYLLVISIVAFFLSPQYSRAADLSLTPATGSVSAGQKLSVQVVVDPSGDSVNASDGTITFDKSLLSVDSVTKDGSVFSLWTADPSFSNTEGTINFSGGTPTAFSNKGKIMTVVFKGKAPGSATISFSKASILAADGKGTDVYKTGNSATLTVTEAASAPAEESTTDATSEESTSDGATPLAPIITSSSHIKPDSWYATSTAVFLWQLPADATSVRTLLSDKDNDIPKIALKGSATSTLTVTGIKDGVSYFYVQLKNDFGWGEVGKIIVHVDTVPPLDFNVALQEPGSDGGPVKFTFKTDDQLSGLDHYELVIGTSSPLIIRAQDVSDGSYPVPPQGGGLQHVTIRAFDKAGNVKEVGADLTLPAIAKPKPPVSAEEAAAQQTPSGFGITGILSVVLALFVGGLFAWNLYTRKLAHREKELLLQAVLEVRDKNDRIFSAMREEFEQMINNFDEKPQLTPQERDLLENIKEVLDISEELVDTSIEDLKKMVRNQP